MTPEFRPIEVSRETCLRYLDEFLCALGPRFPRYKCFMLSLGGHDKNSVIRLLREKKVYSYSFYSKIPVWLFFLRFIPSWSVLIEFDKAEGIREIGNVLAVNSGYMLFSACEPICVHATDLIAKNASHTEIMRVLSSDSSTSIFWMETSVIDSPDKCLLWVKKESPGPELGID